MTSVSTQQQCVSAIHSYCRPSPQPHNNISSLPIPISQIQEENNTAFLIQKYNPPFRFDYWKEAIPLANIFSISVDESLDLTDDRTIFAEKFISLAESLDLTDSVSRFVKKLVSVSESLDLTDTEDTFKEAIISVTESLDLTDDRTIFAEKFISVSETLDLTDSRTIFAEKFISLMESLDLLDDTTKFKEAIIGLAESLDLIESVDIDVIPGAGTFFVSVSETLDLTDSVDISVIPFGPPPPPIGPMTGDKKKKDTIKVMRTMFKQDYIIPEVKRFSVKETLDFTDEVMVKRIPRPLTNVEKFFQAKATPFVQEDLDMIDSVEIKVLRTGTKRILNKIMGIIKSIDFVDRFIPESIGFAQDININLTKTNKKADEIFQQLKLDLKKELNSILEDFKNSIMINDDIVRKDHQEKIYALIRTAVQSSYILGINYVGLGLKESSMFLTKIDLQLIESESERINEMFWKSTFEKLHQYRIDTITERTPLNFLIGLSEDIDSPDESIDKDFDKMLTILAGITTIGMVAKSTQTKLNQMPTTQPTTDSLQPPPKRILVFETRQDYKVCPICVRYQGVEYYEDDPFIVRPIEDTHPNCRCRLLLKDESGNLISG